MNKIDAYKFLESKGYKLFDGHTSAYFSDYYDIFSNRKIAIRFSSSKSKESIDVRNIEKAENWCDLALVQALMQNEENLNKITPIEEYVSFLKIISILLKMFLAKKAY